MCLYTTQLELISKQSLDEPTLAARSAWYFYTSAYALEFNAPPPHLPPVGVAAKTKWAFPL